MDDQPRIAVVGGGIGGLAAAGFLHLAGVASTVYEQASQLTEVGAGIVVAPNAARLLRRLGVMDGFLPSAVRLEVGWEFRRWEDGTVLSAEDLTERCAALYGEEMYTVHRADILDAVRSAVPEASIRLGKKCVRIDDPDGRPRLSFSDGSTETADLVIGADGIHSIARGVVADVARATYSGLCAFRGLVPADRAPAFARRSTQTLWIGPDHHLVHYPVSAGRYVNLVAFAPDSDDAIESWSATATVEEFLAEFEGWDQRVTDLISAAGTPGRWALMDRPPLQRWTRGRVTLLGDAAHAMYPFFAQGAAQAIEDAAVMARCIADGLGDVDGALDRYEAHRIQRANRLQEVSRARAHVNHLPDGREQRERDASFAHADPLESSGWIYAYDPAIALADEQT